MIEKFPLILLIDDDKNILRNLTEMLTLREYEIITERSGEAALERLKEGKSLPDLIICDIKLPDMNGYEFFEIFSQNQAWAHIPFIFLSGLRAPKKIREGKALGVDDYLTKPINRKELLAVIKGKLKRKHITEEISKEAERLLKETEVQKSLKTIKKIKKNTILFIAIWNDKVGPTLKNYYPKEENISFSIQDIGKKLYQCSRFIYGSEKISEPQDLLINLSQIKQSSYLYFDSYSDQKYRSGRCEFMIGILSSYISYFKSKKLKPAIKELSNHFQEKNKLDLEEYWKKIIEILGHE
ncbi:MAG: response regulator [Promethearchaeota archaeon]|nr:MAG: response regulator [Candidatus Lokiarchaeota archaeon]